MLSSVKEEVINLALPSLVSNEISAGFIVSFRMAHNHISHYARSSEGSDRVRNIV